MKKERVDAGQVYVDLINKIKKIESDVDPAEIEELKRDVDRLYTLVPDGASSDNRFALASDISAIDLDIETLRASVSAVGLDVAGINAVIPVTASSSNKLATASDIPTVHNPVSNMLNLSVSGWSYNTTFGTYEKTVSISHINISLPMYLVPYPSRDPQTDTETAMFRLIKYADVASNGNSVTIGCSKQPDNSFACYLSGYS